MTSTLENLRSLEKCDTPRTIFFLTLPWEWSRKCAGGKDEVYNTLPTFSHVFPGENTDYKSFWGEKSSTMVYPVVPCVRATSCIVTVLLSLDERSWLLPNISIIVIRNAISVFKWLWKEIIEIRIIIRGTVIINNLIFRVIIISRDLLYFWIKVNIAK